MEKWKHIDGYENLYKVSNFGNVISMNYNHTGKVRKLAFGNANGYDRVVLCRNGLKQTYSIHRLVASAFIENINNKPTVNHIDENKSNNRVENLEWATYSENINHGSRNERVVQNTDYSQKKYNTDYRIIGDKHCKKIIQCDMDGNEIKVWRSATDIKRDVGYDNSDIGKACRNNKPYRNYIWKYG